MNIIGGYLNFLSVICMISKLRVLGSIYLSAFLPVYLSFFHFCRLEILPWNLCSVLRQDEQENGSRKSYVPWVLWTTQWTQVGHCVSHLLDTLCVIVIEENILRVCYILKQIKILAMCFKHHNIQNYDMYHICSPISLSHL